MLFYPRKELESETRFKVLTISVLSHLIFFIILVISGVIAEKFSRPIRDLNLNINNSSKVCFSNNYTEKINITKNNDNLAGKFQRAKAIIKNFKKIDRAIKKPDEKLSEKPAEKIIIKDQQKIRAEKAEKNLPKNKSNKILDKTANKTASKARNITKKKNPKKIALLNNNKNKKNLEIKTEKIKAELKTKPAIQVEKINKKTNKKTIIKIEATPLELTEREKLVSLPEIKKELKEPQDLKATEDSGLKNISSLDPADSEMIKIDITEELHNNGVSWQEQLKVNIVETINNYELGELGFNKQEIICLIKIDRSRTIVEIEELKANAIYLTLLREALLKVKYPSCLYGKTLKLIIN